MLSKTTGFVAFLLAVSPIATMAGKNHGGSGGRGNGGGSGGKGSKSGGGKYYYDFDIEYSNITCVEDYSCTVGHHGKADNETGSYVCRTSYNLITGDESTDYKCIATDEAWSTDECGCCGDDCPETPSYVELYCDTSADDRRVLKGGGGGGGGHGGDSKGDHDKDDKDDKDYDDEDAVYVCRNLYNPYTGEATTATVTTKNGTALEGDTCGCCDDVCPDDEDDADDDDDYDRHGRDFDIFDAPDYIDATCSDDDLISCDVHDKGHHGSSSNSTTEGLYVCRTSYNTLTGVASQRTQCVVSNRTLEADECGCCDGNCPNEKEDIECTDDDVCSLDNGDSGYYVCRTVHHPVTGDEITSSVCISSDHAFSTDVCGCCDSNCTSSFTSTSSSSSSTVTWSVTTSASSESSSSAAFMTGSFALLSIAAVGAWALL